MQCSVLPAFEPSDGIGRYQFTNINNKLHGPSIFAARAKIYGVNCNQSALSILMKHLIIGQRQKVPIFSAFHWSPHGSLVSISLHFVTTRVVHIPKRTETSLITKADRSGLNHRIEGRA